MITYHMTTGSTCASGKINVNNKYITKNVTKLTGNIFGKINEVIALSLCFPNYVLKISLKLMITCNIIKLNMQCFNFAMIM